MLKTVIEAKANSNCFFANLNENMITHESVQIFRFQNCNQMLIMNDSYKKYNNI